MFKESYLVVVVAATLLLLMVVSSWEAAFVGRGILQFFASGGSSLKVYGFLLWGILLAALLSSPLRLLSGTRRAFLFGLILCSTFSLLSHFMTVREFQLSISDTMIVVGESDVSKTKLFHIHSLKPITAWILRSEAVGKLREFLHLQETGDIGSVYEEILPDWLFVCGFVSLLLTSGLYLCLILERRRVWPKDSHAAYFLLHSIASFAALKNFIDGGPFNTEFFVYTPLLIALTYCDHRSLPEFRTTGAAFLTASLLIGYGIHAIVDISTVYQYLRDFGMLAAFICGVTTLAYGIPNRKLFGSLVGAICLVAAVSLARNHYWAWELNALLRKVPKDAQVLFLGSSQQEGALSKMGIRPFARSENLTVYLLTAEKDTTIYELERTFDLPTLHWLWNILGVDCSPHNTFSRRGKIALSSSSVSRIQVSPESVKSDLLSHFRMKRCSPDEDCDLRYLITINPCIPDSGYEVTINHLRRRDLKNFALGFEKGWIDGSAE